MRTLRFHRNAPPFNAGEVGGIADETLARGYVTAGIASYEDGGPEDAAGTRVGDRVAPKTRQTQAAVGADGAPLPGEAPEQVREATRVGDDGVATGDLAHAGIPAGGQQAASDIGSDAASKARKK